MLTTTGPAPACFQVELLLPEFWDPISGPVFPNKGDQERFWRITRRFVEQLTEGLGVSSVVVVRAMQLAQWHPYHKATIRTTVRRMCVASARGVPPGCDALARSVACLHCRCTPTRAWQPC